jgi:hypothetical protein
METRSGIWWSTWRDSDLALWSEFISLHKGLKAGDKLIATRFLREVSLHVSGSGWRAYDNFIGQPIFYPGFSENMTAAVLSAPILQQRIRALAEKRIGIEEKEGLLKTDDPLYQAKRSQRRAVIEQSLQELSEKLTGDMICKFESKPFIRGAYYMVTQLLTRAYHQGRFDSGLCGGRVS